MTGFKITKKQVSAMLGVTERSVTTFQQNGLNPLPIKVAGRRGVSNQYDARDILLWAVAKEVGKITTDHEGAHIDGEAEKARLTKEQADAVAIKNEETRRNLIPRWLLEWVIEDMASQISPILDAVLNEIKKKDRTVSKKTLAVVEVALAKGRNIAARTKPDFSKLDTIDK